MTKTYATNNSIRRNDFDKYQDQAMSFSVFDNYDDLREYGEANLMSEVGEYFGHLAKAKRGDKPADEALLKKEMGDIFWCLAAICEANHWDMSDVAQMNIDKLTDRKARNVIKGDGDVR